MAIEEKKTLVSFDACFYSDGSFAGGGKSYSRCFCKDGVKIPDSESSERVKFESKQEFLDYLNSFN